MGISVAFTSLLLYLKTVAPQLAISRKPLAFILLTLILITGHLGGSLTHGSDYLSKPLADIFKKDTVANAVVKPLVNVQEAYVYDDVVRPILQAKCYSCHGENKQKGKLRMDDSLMLMKGGKDGNIIYPGNAKESDLIKRLRLPVDNEDHMPPREKSQPSENQIDLLEWWISQGASFGKKVKEVNQTDKITAMLFALQNASTVDQVSMDIPLEEVKNADETIIKKMKMRGIIVLPVSQNSNYLQANFVTDTMLNKEDLELLSTLKKQLIWLKLGNTNISDENMSAIAQLGNLTRLGLEHTGITDHGLRTVQSLQHLQYLNLVGTKVSLQGLLQLKNLPSLHSIYLYQTKIDRKDWNLVQKIFPKTKIDSGGYFVKAFATDTVLVKAKKEY